MRNARICGPRAVAAPFLATAAVLVASTGARSQSPAYLDFDDLTTELRTLVEDSDAARIRSLGTSREGREIWMVELGDPSGAPLDERPAVLVVGNLEGDHLVGSALALEIVRHFVEASGAAEAREVLDETTLYVVPRLNPDGAEAMFADVLRDRKRNARPYDDDNDGRIDEDGPEDVNGDGLVTIMRVADPTGVYMPDPDDPRLMKEADPAEGEEGSYRIYLEGIDSDGDGFLNEDGPGGVDLDRNFQHAYPYWEADAGPHMVSEPETRALMDFVVAHRNVAAILTFGSTDNLVTPPDARGELADAATLDLPAFAAASNAEVYDVGVFRGVGGSGFRFGSPFRGAQPGRDNDPDSGRRPATTVNRADRPYFETVSEAYREITGIEEVGIRREPEGAFFQFGYFQYGVPSFITPGWGLPENEEEADAGEENAPRARGGGRRAGGGRGSSTDIRVLTALEGAGVDAFVEWSDFEHPELGTVEIGGFRPYAATNPPPGRIAELGAAHGAFVARLAGMLPRVRIVDTEVTAHGGGVFTVTADVANGGYFPTSLQHGVVSRSVEPTIVQIGVPPEDLVTGDPKTARIRKLDGSGRRERVTWVVRGRAGQEVEIRLFAQKAGRDTATVTLR